MHENISKTFRDGYYRFGWMHQRPDGTPIPSEIILVRVRYKDGYIVSGYTRDLREHNKIMESLELALKQATEASKAKSDFLSAMSHEMRTPMNAIIGMTSIGKKSDDIEDKNHALNKIGDASAHLLGVINDVLDMAKIEADKLELVHVEFNFERMLQKVMTVVSFRADEKRQTLTVNVDNKIPSFIVGDDQRLAQVITNLTANAVKFTPEGGKIHLDISLVEEFNNTLKLRVEVNDTGIGISMEQQKKLFKAFEQAESGMSREYGGTGLGLVISKNIIELMNGRIWVESELGKGSNFIFIVEVERGAKNTRSLLTPVIDRESVRVLAVDDMPEVLEQFTNIFSELNIKCDVASDGIEACRIIEE
jgi:signal transduction histidine kinase